MELSFKVITAPSELDEDILAFIKENDNDFYPPIAARKALPVFVQGVYTDGGRYILCYDNNKIVGLTTLEAHHPNFLYYYHYIAIDKDYRHKGIGSMLYDMVTEMCEQEGAYWAIVKTWSKNNISQSMFRKHGFYHVHTIEDDRSRGVHSYLFARSFSRVSFKQPVTCLCIAGCGVTVINFAKTLFSFTKDTPDCKGQLAFVMINDPCISTEGKSEIVEGFVSGQLPGTASHLMFTDMAMYRSGWVKEIKCAAEVPDMRAICGNVLDNKDKRWLLAGRSPDQLKLTWDMDNVLLPDEANAARMGDIVADIAAGTTTPAYYKEELVKMTVDNNCDGVLLGSAELHSMFGIDRAFNGIEIFDPLLELAIIVQNNRLK